MRQAVFTDAAENHSAFRLHAMRSTRDYLQLHWQTPGLQNQGQLFCVGHWKYFILLTMNKQNRTV